jgi:hypothetical protein
MMEGKTCIKCGEWRNIEEYHKSPNTKDKRMSKCKSCRKQYAQIYYQKNKERMDQRHKQYKLEHADQVKEKLNEWRARNKEHLKEYKKRYYLENTEMIKEKVKKRQERMKK